MDTTDDLIGLPPLTDDGFLPHDLSTDSETYYTDPANPCDHSHNGAWLCVEVLATFDHDWLGIHTLIQAWDYRQQEDPDQRWQYLLVLACADNKWRPEIVHEWDGRPDFATVGARIDSYLTAPEELRSMWR